VCWPGGPFDQCMQIIVVVVAVTVQVGTHVSSGVVAGVVVKLEDAQRERVQDTETYFLSRQISTEHMQPQ